MRAKLALWDKIQDRLEDIGKDKCQADEWAFNFILSIIISAAKEKDTIYFENVVFKIHCNLIGMDPAYFTQLYNRIWNSDEPFNVVEPEEEEDTDFY